MLRIYGEAINRLMVPSPTRSTYSTLGVRSGTSMPKLCLDRQSARVAEGVQILSEFAYMGQEKK